MSMNGDTDNRRPYPFERGEERRAYPFEKTEGRRSYPFERDKEEREAAGEGMSGQARYRREPKEASERPAGKGRRGSNSAYSIVKHSGKKREDRYAGPAGDIKRHMGHGPVRRRESSALGEDLSAAMRLRVIENTEIGTFLELSEDEKVLLPFAEQIDRPKVGETITVYLFRDKGDRITATMRSPRLMPGMVGLLEVKDVTRIGAFLDNGVPKDILLPFREQIEPPKKGQQVLVYVYKDKSDRTAASMRVYKHLCADSGYKEGDKVRGFVYEISDKLGAFVAVDLKYFGLIPPSELYQKLSYGDEIEARVTKVREDGKLDLSLREKAYISIDADAEAILAEISAQGGELPYADKADPKLIEETFGMSKNQFKRALGHLYREHKVLIDREADRVRIV